jgi:membrane protein
MKLIDPRTAHVLKNPVAFALQVLKAFQANQGLLLAGAVAYYALLSIVLLSLEVAATLLLLGAQVIAEYEGIETQEAKKPPVPMRTEAT